jgi:hypothetical protein
MRGHSVRVQNEVTAAQILADSGGRGLDVQAPQGRDVRGGLRVRKEPHERRLEVFECSF